MSLHQDIEKFFSDRLSFDSLELERYDRHLSLLSEWNQRMNLVSKNSLAEAFAQHYCDSLYLAEFCHRNLGKLLMVDIGTGAGFPGIIFGIRYPTVPLILYEKVQKKRNFLNEVVTQLGLKQIKVGEYFEPNEKRKNIFVMSRAVYPPVEFLKIGAKKFLPGTRLLLTAGGSGELSVYEKVFRVVDQMTYELPPNAGQRRAMICEKK